MSSDDLILVSVDDHVIEPPDMFEGRLPRQFADRAPRVVRLEDGADAWLFEGERIRQIGLNAVAGRPPEDFDVEPLSFDDMRRACWDVDERVRDMNAGGILASMCFPTFVQFCGQLLTNTTDRDLALAVLQAYNDWHLEDWAGAHPGRFIPLCLVPMWDAQLMAAEVRRVAAKGCHAVTFSENPYELGLPSFHDDHWDPFWQACEETETVVCVHIGSSSKLPSPHPDAPMPVTFTLVPTNLMSSAADLLWSPVVHKYPNLKIALSEGGIGWIPYFLERVDYVYQRQGRWLGLDFPGGKLPSQVFRDTFITCFISDDFGVEAREYIGVNNICWGSDYPHSDSTWPTSPETLWESIHELRQEEIRQVTHENAMRYFHFDPFAHVSKDQATAAALRANDPDVDVTFTPPERDRPKRTTGGGLSLTIAESE